MTKMVIICCFICVLNSSFGAPIENEPDLYELNKSHSTHHSKSKSEGGRLKLIRPIIALIIDIIKILLEPLKLGANTAGAGVSLAKRFLPEPKGLDTNHTFFKGLLEDFKTTVNGIAPGTKWCGAGNIAKDNEDFGIDVESDKCCKNHDLCPMNIAAGEQKYGLKNTGLFTRSECSCDKEFYNCLKKVDSVTTRAIGVTYFNTLGPQCFELVDCSDPKIRCRGWKMRGTQYQWSDNTIF
ncbi:phospholipase A2-like [Anthonomus grandis grandis]|uniref:phospholipase A2-like n=1 Tax=Anthonomus grandis grandis TaxID=2921223 RepID=UPI002165E765|nr:phospholipase A2-like [Anthonomus grandis grandis]